MLFFFWSTWTHPTSTHIQINQVFHVMPFIKNRHDTKHSVGLRSDQKQGLSNGWVPGTRLGLGAEGVLLEVWASAALPQEVGERDHFPTCPCNSFPKACHCPGVHHVSVLSWEIFIQTKEYCYIQICPGRMNFKPHGWENSGSHETSARPAGYSVPGPGTRACEEQEKS